MLGLSLQLFSGSTPQANLSDIQAIWWDAADPKDCEKPAGKSAVVTTNATGFAFIDLSEVSVLSIGDSGFLTLYRLDATDHEDSLVFSGKVTTSDIVSGVVLAPVSDWSRPADWLPMPETAANKVCCLVMVNNTDSEYCALQVNVASGNYIVDWGDGSTPDVVASDTIAEHKYEYSDTDLDGTLCSRGYKQAMIVITPQSAVNITSLYFNRRHSFYSAGYVSAPYLDMQVDAPACTVLQTYTFSQSYCRFVERWNIVAFGLQTSQYMMFSQNYSCQTYNFPSGFGSIATNQSQMFAQNYSCQSYNFPAGFGSIAADQYQMFYLNYSCKYYSFPAGFGSSATNQGLIFYANYSCKYYSFPSGFGSIATNQSQGFYQNYSCKSITGNACPISWSVAGMLLTQSELVALFNSLTTVTGSPTLTITGNPGVSALTAADLLIATNKGWVIAS